MKQQSKLSARQQEEQTAELRAAKAAGRQFDSVEELIRYDAGQTLVPPGIAQRLRQSISQSESPPRGWWRRLLD
jgi:hypothetical protein